MRFGLKGSADILGIGTKTYSVPDYKEREITLHHIGVFLAIEAKTGAARQSREQKAFQAMIERFGGFYLVAKSPEEVTEWLDRVLG